MRLRVLMLTFLSAVMVQGASAQKKILVYGPSMIPSSPNEQSLAAAAGHTVTVADAGTWSTLTTAQFAAFDAIVFGDPDCVVGTSPLAAASANKGVWSPAITGPKVLIGTDPFFHRFTGQAQQLITNGIDFAASGPGTGLYVSLSCYYALQSLPTPVDFLSLIGNFEVLGQAGCPNSVSIVNPSHPAVAALTNAGLSNWFCSMHEWFSTFPSSFSVLATETSGSPASRPYIIAAGGGGCSVQVTRESQGDDRWKRSHYDEIRWITADFPTANSTPVTSSTALELLVGSTPYQIPISSSNNTLNGLRDAINSLGAGVAATVIPKRNKQTGATLAYYLSLDDTVGNVCQVCGGLAANLQLQTTPGVAASNILTTKTIQNLGCALTSLSMALNVAALKFSLSGLPSNPDVLNQFMIARDLPPSRAGDYGSGGAVSFAKTTYDIRNNFLVDLKWTDARLRCNDTSTCLSSSSLPNIGQYLDQQLCSQSLPVIAGVNLDLTGTPGTNPNYGTPGHFVLITGKSGDRYTINDPGFPKSFLDEYPNFETRGVVSDPVGDISRLDVSVGTPADLLVTDPNGNSTGFNSITGQAIEDIPQSVYLRDGLQDDVTGEASTEINHSVGIYQPTAGSYTLVSSGLALDIYNLTIRGFRKDGTAQDAVVIPGIAAPGSTFTVHLQVASSPGAPLTVMRLATFQSTLSDITNSLQLGLIDNEGIANSLSQKVRNAQNAMEPARAHILNAFINEVTAQSGKHITGVAVQVLLQDAHCSAPR